jgi:hypothetical protein
MDRNLSSRPHSDSHWHLLAQIKVLPKLAYLMALCPVSVFSGLHFFVCDPLKAVPRPSVVRREPGGCAAGESADVVVLKGCD